MNQKYPFHELSRRLATLTSVSEESAEAFAKAYFAVIAETLESGQSISVKGLGTFSIAEGDTSAPRTVIFEPDPELAEALNAPFLPFEPVTLPPGVTPEMLDTEEHEGPAEEAEITAPQTDTTLPQEAAPEPHQEPLPIPEPEPVCEPDPATQTEPEPAVQVITEAHGVQEIATVPPPPPAAAKPVATPPTPPPAPAVSPTPPPPPAPIPAPAPAPEPQPEPEPAPEPVPATEPQAAPEPAPASTPPAFEEDPEEYVDTTSQRSAASGPGFGLGLVIGLIVGIAIGACGLFLAIDYVYPRAESSIGLQEEETTAVIPATPAPAPADSAVASAPAAEPPTQPETTPAETATAAPQALMDTIRKGYLLNDMAKRHYGRKDFWVYIYEENRSAIPNPNTMRPGQVLSIPPASKYGIDPTSETSIAAAKRKAAEILGRYRR